MDDTMPELLSEHACFGGVQRFYRYDSAAIGLPMRFSVYLPPGYEGQRLPGRHATDTAAGALPTTGTLPGAGRPGRLA